jgi:aminopeptidase N
MIKRSTILCFALFIAGAASAQLKDSTYRASATIINNLVHTKLAVRFDYAKRYLYGKGWITLHPHFYPTDSLTLNAKGMEIKEVALVSNGKKSPLKYQYDGLLLKIKLDKTYKSNEKYTVYVDYVSKPDELKDPGGSAAITSSKGLYFINPDGKEKDKPIEIWTQGETAASSVWFPTIDQTNQKTTSEIAMTVQGKYVTLSNGRLASQVKNADGTRTDTWKMELPHAPYLFMMAVGDFKIYKDTYNGKEVSYYLEPAYAPYAKEIFGNTPEMIKFYEHILGIPYPWVKYSQIVCRDYVSGAMENTTATLHGEYVHRNSRQLLDADPEDYISHELFHQWFGDLVTGESWSNLTLHESFANYSEFLWYEHKYGRDRADEHYYNDIFNTYFPQADGGGDGDLVRYHYDFQEDVFDGITYQKGGKILHMLRNYLGDDAFFKGLNLYLKQNAFKTAEVANLRMAFEEVSGQDLNWYFNQWYFGKGYPDLDVSYKYDEGGKTVSVTVKQTQKDKVFKLPFAIDIYEDGKKIRNKVMLDTKEQTFTFGYTTKPDLVTVDGDRVLVAKINENKTLDQLIFQYHHAGLYRDRHDAIEACLKEQLNDPNAQKLLLEAIKDKYYGLQSMAIDGLKLDSGKLKDAARPILEDIAKNDPKSTVRASAILQLGNLKDQQYKALFEKASLSKSYEETGAGLTGLSQIDLDDAYQLAKKNESDVKGRTLYVDMSYVYIKKGNEADIPFFQKRLATTQSFGKLNCANMYEQMMMTTNKTTLVVDGLNQIKAGALEVHNAIANRVFTQFLKQFGDKKKVKADAATDATLKAELNKQADYTDKVIEDINQSAK